jgi:hypothetical protein
MVLPAHDPADRISPFGGEVRLRERLGAVAGMWKKTVGTISVQIVAVVGDAIRVPTVIEIVWCDETRMQEHIVGGSRRTEVDLVRLAS